MPFSRSRSIESITRSATSWLVRKAPDCHSILSTSVVLPWSTWAMMATLRMSWRVATEERSYADPIESLAALDPADPEDDLERLARLLFGMAVELLRRRGRFFPFGGVIWSEGGAEQLVAAPPEEGKDASGLLDALVGELRAEAAAGRVRAAGTCVDVRQDPDLGVAIRADLEDSSGDARVALLQYERRFPLRFLIFPDPVEHPGAQRISADRNPA